MSITPRVGFEIDETAMRGYIERKMARVTGFAVVAVEAGAGSGRSKSDNAMIAKAHARGSRDLPERNPFFIDGPAKKRVRELIQDFIALGGLESDKGLEAIGAELVNAIRRNIDAAKGKGGKFERLSDAYRASKAKRSSRFPDDILKASGALYDGLRAVWEIVRAPRR